MSTPTVSIVVPVFNEEPVLRPAISQILADLERSSLNFEILMVENGSNDGTYALAEEMARRDPRLKAIHLSTPNYGLAMQTGFLAAMGDYIGNFSIDFADVDFLQTAIAQLADYGLVLGSKYVAGGFDRRPLPRRLGGMVLSGFVRVLFGLPVSDTHGLLAMRRDQVAPIVARCHFGNEVFDTELVVRVHRAGLKMRELPVEVEEKRPSRLGSLRRALRMLAQFTGLRIALWKEGV